MYNKEKELRRTLALANLCRGFLNSKGLLTATENERMHRKIMEYKKKNHISITDEQLSSADFKYDDDAKEFNNFLNNQ